MAKRRVQRVKPLAVPGQQVNDLAYYRWIGPREAIEHLGLGSRTALYRLIAEHRLPFGRVGRQYRFRRDHLDQWAVRRGVEAIAAVSQTA